MARRYKGACLTMSRRGPDSVLLARTLWLNVAIPAIFFGTESLIFSDTTISKLNSIQSQVFKAILSLPISTHNIVTQTECGIPHISYFIYKRQLLALHRLYNLPVSSWAHKAAMEHLSISWDSPFFKYILKVKQRVGITSLYDKKYILDKLEKYSLSILNNELDMYRKNLPAVKPIKKIMHQDYVTESKTSKLLVGIIYNHCAHFQCQGMDRQRRCEFCPRATEHENLPPKSSEFHVLWECSEIKYIRYKTGIQSFINSCIIKNISLRDSYYLYLRGLDIHENKITAQEFSTRISSILAVREAWIKKIKLKIAV